MSDFPSSSTQDSIDIPPKTSEEDRQLLLRAAAVYDQHPGAISIFLVKLPVKEQGQVHWLTKEITSQLSKCFEQIPATFERLSSLEDSNAHLCAFMVTFPPTGVSEEAIETVEANFKKDCIDLAPEPRPTNNEADLYNSPSTVLTLFKGEWHPKAQDEATEFRKEHM